MIDRFLAKHCFKIGVLGLGLTLATTDAMTALKECPECVSGIESAPAVSLLGFILFGVATYGLWARMTALEQRYSQDKDGNGEGGDRD